MMQTINNPDGTVSIIQIDGGPNSVVTLADGSQATVVHAVSCNKLRHHASHSLEYSTFSINEKKESYSYK